MQASGFLVLSIDNSCPISVEVDVTTTARFIRCCYGDTCVQSIHAEHRDFMERLLTTIQDASPLALPSPHHPDTF